MGGTIRLFVSTFCLAMAAQIASCGGAEVSDKLKRKSERHYEAASISWFEENDSLSAIRNLSRAVDANPQNDHAQYLLGIIRFGRGEYDEAEKHLRATVMLRSDKDPAGLSGAQNNLGLLLIHKKQYHEAIKLLEASAGEVLNREPWLAMGNLGWAYIEIGEYDKAIQILRRAMFDQPKYCVGLFWLGQAFYNKKDYESAKNYLKQSISIPEPGCDALQKAHHLLAMSHLRMENSAQAAAAFSRCKELAPMTEVGQKCAEALSGL